jgi:hypothetical protein
MGNTHFGKTQFPENYHHEYSQTLKDITPNYVNWAFYLPFVVYV